MMSTVFTNPLIQRENSSKTEPSQDPAQRPVGSQPTIDENDSKHDLLHHDNGHEQGEKEADTEHQKEAVEAILPLTTEDKPGVSIESFSEKEAQRQQKAATVIQSVCRGYQARQDLYGPALTASQKWRYLVDHSRIELIHKWDAIDLQAQGGSNQGSDDPNQPSSPQPLPSDSRTRWALRRAEFLSSLLGKGSNGVSAEEALVLRTEHWLEMSDKKHRYGSNLKVYHGYWLAQDTLQNFFYWLDKGDGKEVDLEERPRTRLDEQRVHYLQEHERAQYVVHIVNGLFYYKQSGQRVHTLPTSVKAEDIIDASQILPDTKEHDDKVTQLEKKQIRNKSKFIYVTDPKGVLYIAQKVKGQFHHSSFLGGGTVCAAGGILVNQGKLITINPRSGHYRPGQRHFDRLLSDLEQKGISLEGVKVSKGFLEAELDGDGNQGVEQQAGDAI